MSLLAIIGLSITTIGLTYLWVTREPQEARSVYNKAEFARQAGGALFLVITVYTLFQSGDLFLMVLGALALGFVTLYLLIEKPYKEVTP